MSKITISDIAKKAGVSSMTVSRVINGNGPVAPKTSEKIKKIILDNNYQPNLIARSLSSNKTMTIGVMIPKSEKLFLDNYIAEVLSGISDAAQSNEYRIMLIPFEEIPGIHSDSLNLINSRLFDGLVLLKSKITDPNISFLAESGFPFVVVNYRKYAKNINFVDSENVKGAEIAMRYLYDKGHRKIAFVEGVKKETNSVDRLKGYLNFLKEYNLKYVKEYIICGEFDKDIAFERSKKIMELKDRPTAIFCSDDYMAIGVMERIKTSNLKVPEDIAVVGFDNIELSKYVKPALTTITQPMYDIGKNSVQILMDIISKKVKPPIRKMLKTELVIRDST